MLMFLADVCLTFFIAFLIVYIFELFRGGKIIIKGTKKYDDAHKTIDQQIKESLKNGTGSSKEELQEWWDKYH